MSRELDVITLTGAAKHLAAEFLQPNRLRLGSTRQWISGPSYVKQELFNYKYRDEHAFILEVFKARLGGESMDRFLAMEADGYFTPRSEETFLGLLSEALAIDGDGEHIPGRIGTVKVGGRFVGRTLVTVETVSSLQYRRENGLDNSYRETHDVISRVQWPVYAGEEVERDADSGAADRLPTPAELMMASFIRDEGGALATRIGNSMAIAMADAGVDLLSEGSLGGVLQGRTTPRPSQVDDAVTGTNLFTLTLSGTGFGGATDGAPGGLKTANAITSDSSADDTGTLLYVRASSSNVSVTPLNDHIEGEAGTSGADFTFNTLEMVAGALVDMTSWTITQPES